MLIQTSVLMMFQQQKKDNYENENEDCKTAMISTKNKTVNDKTIIMATILQLIVQQYLLLYSLNTILLHFISYLCAYDNDLR